RNFAFRLRKLCAARLPMSVLRVIVPVCTVIMFMLMMVMRARRMPAAACFAHRPGRRGLAVVQLWRKADLTDRLHDLLQYGRIMRYRQDAGHEIETKVGYPWLFLQRLAQ